MLGRGAQQLQVRGTRNSSREGPEFVEYVGLADETGELVGWADFVVDALPLTDQTRGLFDKTLFASMKRGAFFLNIGRGETVVRQRHELRRNTGGPVPTRYAPFEHEHVLRRRKARHRLNERAEVAGASPQAAVLRQ